MSLMSFTQLVECVEKGVIQGVDHKDINGSSIDVYLANEIIIEKVPAGGLGVVDPSLKTNFTQERVDLSERGEYLLMPGEFILGSTTQKFNLPLDVSGEFRLNSSGARSGLDNLFACHCDPGWTGSSLTLELKNELRFHAIRLTPGMRIGQVLFHKHTHEVPASRSYYVRGRYNEDTGVSAVKP